jgi:hypothetical protein
LKMNPEKTHRYKMTGLDAITLTNIK